MDIRPRGLKHLNLAPLEPRRYERYLPTAFNDSLTLVQKVNKVIHYLYEYSDLTYEMLEKWNEVYSWVMNEGLDEAIGDRLQEWYDSGKLEHIINELIFGELNDRIKKLERDFITLINDFDEFKEQMENDFDELSNNIDDKFSQLENSFNNLFIEFKDEIKKEVNKLFINVNLFDGDDYERIQKGLDLASIDGGIVYIPDGNYVLDKGLIIGSHTTLYASKNAHLLKNHTGYMLANGRKGDSFKGYNGNGHIKVIGGTWNANGNVMNVMHNCFAFGHAENLIFEDITIKDVAGAHAIELNGVRNAKIRDCKFLGYVDTGGRNFSEAVQLDLMKGSGYFGAFGEYDNTPCDDVTIENCLVDKSESAGAYGRGFGSHASTIGRWHKNIKIINNTIKNTGRQAIRGFSWENSTISGNQIINCGGGVAIVPPLHSSNPNNTIDVNGTQTNNSQVCENFIISDNIIQGGITETTQAIYVVGSSLNGQLRNVTITGNIISGLGSGNSARGIYVRECSNVTVSGNSIRDTGNFGIHVYEGYEFSVVNNTIKNVGSSGIRVQFSKRGTINGNLISEPEAVGISINDESAYINIVANSLYRSGSHGIHLRGSDCFMFTVGNNTISGANGRGETDTQGIRITDRITSVNIVGNSIRISTNSYRPTNAIRVTATVINVSIMVNNGRTLGKVYTESDEIYAVNNVW